MSGTITINCARCKKKISVTDTDSLYKPDGKPYMIFCDTCWHEHMEGKVPGHE